MLLDDAEAKAGNKRRGGGGLKKKTVAKSFAESLSALMEKLRSTEHHYIRCLKPNHLFRPNEVSPRLLLQQLRFSSIVQKCSMQMRPLNARSQQQIVRKKAYQILRTHQNFALQISVVVDKSAYQEVVVLSWAKMH